MARSAASRSAMTCASDIDRDTASFRAPPQPLRFSLEM